MHIINTENRLIEPRFQIANPRKRNTLNHWLLILIWCLVIGILAGCAPKCDLRQPQDYVQESENLYQKAITQYRDLILHTKTPDKLYLELGLLYYSHGDFEKAIDSFKNTPGLKAKKFIAISYYRMANFADALEIFNRFKIHDDEYLYYEGLTCEKLNLFDQALKAYSKIESDKFGLRAKERIEAIEKEVGLLNIKDIDPQINKILANVPSKELYPQAGALILACDERIEVSSDGTQVSYLHYLIKILNERGKEDFSETHIDYDSTFEKVELEYARTIKPDGTVTDVGSRHIRDVSKYLNFPLYSNAHVFIISFPEITEGASIEYKLKIRRNQLINKKDFVLSYPVQASEPIINAHFSITLPKERTLNIKIINEGYNDFAANLNPDIEERQGRLIYRWQFKDIPQIIPESNMPPEARINPALLISTFNSWQEIYKWWWGLASGKIKADEAIRGKVKELVKNKGSEEEKARAIYNFCAQKIRYVAVEYGEAGYEPHFASDIFRNKYGDCKDQAILLVSMLKEAGIRAWPVLIATRDYYNLNPDFPAIFFNHCIAAVYLSPAPADRSGLKGKVIFLDPTAETCSFGDLPPGDQERRVLIFQEDTYELQDTPLYPAEHNLVRQELKIKANNDETITAKKSIFTFGFYEQGQRYWLLYTQPELVQEALKEKIQEVSIGAKLDMYNIENLKDLNLPTILDYSFHGPEYFTPAGNLRIMPQLTSLDTSLVAKDKRKYAIDFVFLDTKETYFEIEIPQNFMLKYMPDSLTRDSPWIKFAVEYSHKDNKIFFEQKIQIKKNIVSESEYPDFKNFFEGLAKSIKQRVVLERVR